VNVSAAFSPEEITAIRLSLKVAFWAMTASLPVGIVVALLLARGRFWGMSLLNGVVHLPLIMPPVVTGYILLLLFGRRGPLGLPLDEYLGIVFAFRWTGAALACAIMGFPLMVRSIRLSLDAVDRGLESAAGTLGANRLWVFLTITLPLIVPGILARHDPLVCALLRRVWGDHYLRLEHPGRDPDAPLGDLHLYPDTGRRSGRAPPDPGLDRDIDGRAARV
jgi:ABC-type molybdate transport system permease subunit